MKVATAIHIGDCLDILRTLPENSVDSIVTDPPYGLKFMGRRWDYDAPSVEVWAECLRVLRPGGHLLAFAGTRTQHRMCTRIEDAGFEIRDMIAWIYGSGFPKSHNGPWGGTALKPALEPITMARKPLEGTVAANVLAHGTGALNIDGCRVPAENPTGWGGGAAGGNTWTDENCGLAKGGDARPVNGRWPANLIHDGSDEVLQAFPHTGPTPGSYETSHRDTTAYSGSWPERIVRKGHKDAGGSAARFFYCAKASKRDRDEGLESFDRVAVAPRANNHPTVKPTDLMRYLCRLITPAGGTVLDQFMGSGSTGKAAVLEGFGFIGIEREAQYAAIAEARVAHATEEVLANAAAPSEDPAQIRLFGDAA